MKNNNLLNKVEYEIDERGVQVIDLDDALETMLEREFNQFKRGLKKLPKGKIIEKAYELICKEEIKEELKYMELHDAEKEMMLIQGDILDEFYHDWLNEDTTLGESMQNSISESIGMLTRYMGKMRGKKER
ncbi:MAG: DUF3848 domain-containing protein [Clostridia bacterium]|nr:DUF3848 domain-containing protein [Clostridia bacterium]